MERMAIQGGGHFYFIEDARQIPDFLHRELGEVLSTCARQVSLTLTLPPGVEAHLLNSFETERVDGGIRVRLDDMIAGEVRTLVWKLSARAGAEGVTLPLALQLRYTDADSGTQHTLESREAVLLATSPVECANEQPNAAVVEEAALLEVALARAEALRLDAAGQYAQAAATLGHAAVFLAAAAPASPVAQAEVDALRAEQAEAPGGLNAMARKAMHYAQSTRRQSRQK